MRRDKFLRLLLKSKQQIFDLSHASLQLSIFFGLVLALGFSFGCAPSSSEVGVKQSQTASDSENMPELTEEMIRERINGKRVREVPEENGNGEPIVWNFDEDEPKEIAVVEKQLNGERATIVLDIKTQSAPGWRNPRSLAGQIRTHWELRTGWVMRRWEIIKTENISMKYKNLPKPPASNSNR